MSALVTGVDASSSVHASFPPSALTSKLRGPVHAISIGPSRTSSTAAPK